MDVTCRVPVLEKIDVLVSPSSDQLFHSLPNEKALDQSKLKAFADDKINVT